MIKGLYTGLRAIEKQDLPQLLKWRNKPEYRRYFREYRELSYEHQKLWYERISSSGTNNIMFAIVELESNKLLGACGLCHINWINRSGDFSIYIGADNIYIDDKFAPDAGSLLLNYGFNELNLHRIWAEIYNFDEPKKKLFKDLGLVLEGEHRETYWHEGKWFNSLFFSTLSSEFNLKKF